MFSPPPRSNHSPQISSSSPVSTRGLQKSFTKASMKMGMVTPHKLLKTAIEDGVEEKAITIFLSKIAGKIDLSEPFPTRKSGSVGDTPLHLAVRYGMSKLLETFLNYGGDGGVVNLRGETCLHLAGMVSYSSSMNDDQLSASEMIPDPSAMIFVDEGRRMEIVTMLCNWQAARVSGSLGQENVGGLDLNARDSNGNTALHIAASHGFAGVVSRLVMSGASMSLFNNAGESVCDVADMSAQHDVANMIEVGWAYCPPEVALSAAAGWVRTESMNSVSDDGESVMTSLSGGSITGHGNSHTMAAALSAWEDLANTIRVESASTYSPNMKNTKPTTLLLTADSVTPQGMEYFVSTTIRSACEKIGETAARSEVLLDHCGWSLSDLQLAISKNRETILEESKLAYSTPTMTTALVTDEEIPSIDVGIPIEDVYVDPCFQELSNFVVYRDGVARKFGIHCENNGRSSVLPDGMDPSFRYIASMNSTSDSDGRCAHQRLKIVGPCGLCNTDMLEPVGLQYYLQDEVLQPSRREIVCAAGHSACLSCWKSFYLEQLCSNEGIGRLSCIQEGCGEILDLKWAPVLLNEEEINQLNDQRVRYLSRRLNLHRCPAEDCPLLIHIDANALTALAPHIPASAACAHGHLHCLRCHGEMHAPASCSGALSWTSLIATSWNNSVKLHEEAAFARATVRRCTSCYHELVKRSGCSWVCCSVCSKQSCWACMGDVRSHTSYRDDNGELVVGGCNRYERQDGEEEEKADDDDDAGGNNKDDFERLLHRFRRYVIHSEAHEWETRAMAEVSHRLPALVTACSDGEIHWLHGHLPFDPLSHSLESLTSRDGTDSSIGRTSHGDSSSPSDGGSSPQLADMYLQRNRLIGFLVDAFEELARSRSYLRWSYPFVHLEVDRISPPLLERVGNDHQYASYIVAERLKAFEDRQGALEHATERLSFLVASGRLRGSRAQIVVHTHRVMSRRRALERFVLSLYEDYHEELLSKSIVNVSEPFSSPVTAMDRKTIDASEESRARLDALLKLEEEAVVEQQQQHQQNTYIEQTSEVIAAAAAVSAAAAAVSQRVIGAKKDADEEALEHAILISLQEQAYGVNMYDSLRAEDEPTIAEFMSAGFTREESILIVFENKFGATAAEITPAMPTLHKINNDVAVTLNPLERELDENDEEEIERLMIRGFTREQSVQVIINNRRRALQLAEDQRIAAEASSQRVGMSRTMSSVSRIGSEYGSTTVDGRTTARSVISSTSSIPPVYQNSTHVDAIAIREEVAQLQISLGLTTHESTEITSLALSGVSIDSAVGMVLRHTRRSANNVGGEDGTAAVMSLMNTGMARETATQAALQGVTRSGGRFESSLLNAATREQSVASNQMHRQSSLVGTISGGSGGYQSSSGILADIELSTLPRPGMVLPSQLYPGYALVSQEASTELTMMMSAQEQELSKNMYENLSPSDNDDLSTLYRSGYSHDEAAYIIFQLRHGRPLAEYHPFDNSYQASHAGQHAGPQSSRPSSASYSRASSVNGSAMYDNLSAHTSFYTEQRNMTNSMRQGNTHSYEHSSYTNRSVHDSSHYNSQGGYNDHGNYPNNNPQHVGYGPHGASNGGSVYGGSNHGGSGYVSRFSPSVQGGSIYDGATVNEGFNVPPQNSYEAPPPGYGDSYGHSNHRSYSHEPPSYPSSSHPSGGSVYSLQRGGSNYPPQPPQYGNSYYGGEDHYYHQ